MEGPWLPESMVDDASIPISRVDLEAPLPPVKAELAICLEVAEHLSRNRAESLVAELCSIAPLVLFGAAIPNQGGVGHVNLEWQSIWAERFLNRGYQPRDLIRPRIWSVDRLPYWYRQNALVYVDAMLAQTLVPPPNSMPLDVVHPTLYSELAKNKPGVRERIALAFEIPQLITRKIKRQLLG